MKRLLCVLLLVTVLLTVTANAKGFSPDKYTTALAESTEPSPDKYISDFAEGSENVAQASERLKAELTLSSLLRKALACLKDSFFSYLTYFMGLIFIVIISGVFMAIKDSLPCAELTDCICNLSLCSYILALVCPLCDNVESICKELCTVMLAMLPSIGSVYAGSVGVSTATASHAGTVGALGAIQSAIVLIVIPGVKVILILSCARSMTRFMDMSGFCSFVKSILMWVLGLLTMLISAVMYFQTVLASSTDRISTRGIRFVAQRAIPIVGSVVSDSVRVIGESMSLVKSVCGLSGITTILLLALPPVALIVVYRLFFSFSQALSGMLGYKQGKELIQQAYGISGILLACVVSVLLILVVLLGIFISCSVKSA